MKKKAVMVCLVNRCMRDPHVQWCESLSPSATAGGAGYSIVRSFFSSHEAMFSNVSTKFNYHFYFCYNNDASTVRWIFLSCLPLNRV